MNINLTLFAQAVTFAVFIWFCAHFIWPHLTRAIEDRQKQIADGHARRLDLRRRQPRALQRLQALFNAAVAGVEVVDGGVESGRWRCGADVDHARAPLFMMSNMTLPM